MCFIELEGLGYSTSASITILPTKPLEELKQRNAITVLELVTKKLRVNLHKLPKSPGTLFQSGRIPDHQDDTLKALSNRQIKKTLYPMVQRLNNDLAASLVEVTKLKAVFDRNQQDTNTKTSSGYSSETQSVIHGYEKQKIKDMARKNGRWKVERDEFERELMTMKSQMKELEAERKRTREPYELNDAIRSMYERSGKRQRMS
jgi:hypothetical protein